MSYRNLLTIAMIVKNETEIQKHIIPTLVKNSLSIVVLDTGSTDNTPEYLRSFGVKVYEISDWNGDFALARNVLLDKIKTPWVLMLDADEYISKGTINKIIKIISKTEKYIFKLPIYQNKLNEFKKNTEKNFRSKLFRTDKGFKYIRPLNEFLDIENKVFDIEVINASIYHWGFDAEQNKERFDKKLANYIQLFNKILLIPKYQKDAMLHFQLGGHYKRTGELKKATIQFIKAVRYGKNYKLIAKYMFYYELVRNWEMEGKIKRAIKLLEALEKRNLVLNRPLYFYLGRFYFLEKKFETAKKYLLKSLSINNAEEEIKTSYIFEVKGLWQYIYLATIEEISDNLDEAQNYWLIAKKMQDSELVNTALHRVKQKKGLG